MSEPEDLDRLGRELRDFFDGEKREAAGRTLRSIESEAERKFQWRRETECWRRKNLRAGVQADYIPPGTPPPPEQWAALEYAETRLKAMTEIALDAVGTLMDPQSYMAFVKRAIQSLSRLCVGKLEPWEDNSINRDDSLRTNYRNAIWFFLSRELSGALPSLLAEARRAYLHRIPQPFEDGRAEEVPKSKEACHGAPTEVLSHKNGTAGQWVYQMMLALSPAGLVSIDQGLSQKVYLEADADLNSASEDAFAAELSPGKPSGDLGARAAVVRLSKRLEELTVEYFEKFTRGIDEKYRSQLAGGGDPALTSKWRQAAIETFAPKLWRDIEVVWSSWLDRVRTMTDGAAYGARIRTVDDPELLTLAAHERRMTEVLAKIGGRYAIPAPILRNVLEAAERSRSMDPSDLEPVGSTNASNSVLISRGGAQQAIGVMSPESKSGDGAALVQAATPDGEHREDTDQRQTKPDRFTPTHSFAIPVRLFRKDGDVWDLAFNGKSVHVKHSKGMSYIAHLLRTPDKLLSCLELVAAEKGVRDLPRLGFGGEVIDQAALGAYIERREDLEDQLNEAEHNCDQGTKEAVQQEMEKLDKEVESACGLGGRHRRLSDDFEKLRKGVSNAIKRAIEAMRKYDPDLAEHFKRYIKRGLSVRYCSDGTDWKL
jgi:hypothetical protein